MAKMLSERAAWLRLAAVIEDKLGDGAGICVETAVLFDGKQISGDMYDRIKAKLPRGRGVWKWPCDEKGDRARVRFCIKQAKALEPKKRKK